jgi:hypothetical protein
VHQGDVSVYVEDVDLIYLRRKYNYKKHEGKTDKNTRTQNLLDALKLLAPVDVIEFQTTEAYSNLDLTNAKYSTYMCKQSREGNLKVVDRIRPSSFMHSENMK